MPSRRELIAMTPEEIDAYLRHEKRIIVVTNGANGFPHPVPMNFGVDAAGRVVMLTFAKSQKVKNLERDPRATLLVESGRIYAELKSVILSCRTEIITPGPEFEAVRADFGEKPQIRTAQMPEMLEQIAASMAKRVALRFTTERVVSWDHAKLAGKY
jgi:nitroimidazol reductase NimA-like FMN-containing flavoprotein (pyridoxamine 5'-phosphate oxidase superfamily)